MIRFMVRLCAAAIFAVLPVSSFAQSSQRLVLPDGVFYYQPASTVYGSEAAWINPAGIGRYGASNGQFMADYANKNFLKNWGGVVCWQDFGLAYRTLRMPGYANFKNYIIAAGVPVSKGLAVGGSYQYFKGGPADFDKQLLWSIGILKQGGGQVSWGAVFSNLNRINLAGSASEIEQRYSIGLQSQGGEITAAVDMMLGTKTKFKNADFVYHAEIVPMKGLFIDASIDSHRQYQFGARVNLLQYFAGWRSRFARGGHGRGSTFFVGATSVRQPSVIADPPKRLHAAISGSLQENPPQPIIGRKAMPYPTLLLSLYRAAKDPYISDVALYISGPSLGFARAQELRDAIMQIRVSGKQVVCHLSNPGNLSYYVACAADRIIVPPVSQLNLIGLRAEMTFYAGTMEKIGVHADMVKIGAYKTAAEPFTRTSSSDENKEQMNRLLDNLYSQFVDGIAQGRELDKDSVRALIDRGPFTSEEALAAGLVDALYYVDQVDSSMGYHSGIALAQYQKDTLANYRWASRPVLAVVVAEGDINGDNGIDGLGSESGVTPGKMKRAFAQAVTDKRVKGIVFRIDSPGGDALASDDIFHTVLAASSTIPVTVSMGNDAASGGFYAAMPGRKLFASAGSITGSIGIFGGKPDLSNLYQKLNLGKELYTRGHFAGMMTNIRPFTEEERQKYYDQLNAFYGHFVDLVAGNRGLSRDSVDSLGRGRVWTGVEAIENGLIDQIGGLRSALDDMAKESGLTDYDVQLYPTNRPLFIFPTPPLLGGLISIFSGHSGSTDTDRTINSAQTALNGGLFARIPYDLVIE
jgi:protease-4